MPSNPKPLTIERVLAISRRIGEDLPLGYRAAVETLLEEIRLVSGASASRLVEWDEQGEHVTESRSGPGPGLPADGLTTPVVSVSGDHVVAEIRLTFDEGCDMADDAAVFSAFLTSGLASLVALEVARNGATHQAAHSAESPRRTMAAVRVVEDEIGNSISVVRAWLRMTADRAPDVVPLDGLSTSVRRLEVVQESVGRLLAHTQAEAIGRHAGDRVNATALVRPAGKDLANEHVWIAANRTELVALLKMEPAILGDTPSWSEASWSLPLAVPSRLTSDIATAILASGSRRTGDRVTSIRTADRSPRRRPDPRTFRVECSTEGANVRPWFPEAA